MVHGFRAKLIPSIDGFIQRLLELGVSRAFLVADPVTARLTASHPELTALARAVETNTRDYAGHEAIFLGVGAETRALFGVFLHRTLRGQGAGGVRHWPYATLRDYLDDGLRLAHGMGRKNALAGLWWGGGKGVIARKDASSHEDPDYRRTLYREYGSFVSSLRGAYVTAEDVGTTAEDMASVFETTRFTTCIPQCFGGSGDPSVATARGVVSAMEGALHFLDRGTLAGTTIAVQGLGHVATAMLGELLARGVRRIVASDIDADALDAARARFDGAPVELRRVAPDDPSLLWEACDVLAPCALGGVLNPETIPGIRAPVVCGAANNQLLDEERDAALLLDHEISYVPDFVANRMGIVSCANEQYGVIPNDLAVERHFDRAWDDSIFCVTERVLARSRAEGVTTSAAANSLADELGLVPHPIWGHRTRHIVQALVAGGWSEAGRRSLPPRGSRRSLCVSMQAPFPNETTANPREASPAEALVRLLERHGLEDSLREILLALEERKKDRQAQARLEVLEHLLEGQPPLTEEEIEAARREWQE
jgi:glutamate dehydrogenase/leucine dehydrogenase